MSAEAPFISASFVVGGDDFDVLQLSELIGITPTRVWNQKLQHLRQRPGFSDREWIYHIDRKEQWSVNDSIVEILDIFWPLREVLVAWTTERKLRISVVCSIYNDAADPVYDISRESVARLADLSAGFCMLIGH